MASYLHHTATT